MINMILLKKILMKVEYVVYVLIRNFPWNFEYYLPKRVPTNTPKIIGIMRARNESLLLKDTLDHASLHVDGVIVFDDDSSDNSVDIALNHPIVLEVIKNKKWRSKHRKWEETSNRKLLSDRAEKYGPSWIFYFDADERFEGDVRTLLHSIDESVDAIRISLLDAYITQGDRADFTQKDNLMNFRKMFGLERRDILMIWRGGVGAQYLYPDSREPANIDENKVITRLWCQHYGKAVSIQQWEDTCKYYSENFPMYAEKWRARMGRAVHEKSDFNTKLYAWEQAKSKSVLMR